MDSKARRNFLITLTIVVIVALLVSSYFIKQVQLISLITSLMFYQLSVLLFQLLFVMMFTSKKVESDERRKLTAYIPLFLSAIVFWAIEEQSSTIIAVWGESRSNLDPTWFGITFHIDPSGINY
jgi:proton-dependent oligopeptide transporter, POT family